MGGNLYKLGRVSKERYFEIYDTIKPTLDTYFGSNYRIPRAYSSKADYGDLDIIINSEFLINKPKWHVEITELLGVGECEIKRVRNVVSINYMGIQTDFFVVKSSNFESTYNFMCFNILGNLLGRIFHKFGLKYGEDGLQYVFRSYTNHVSKEIVLSKDMSEILKFLKLDYNKWENGFDNLEEIFQYIIECPYFSTKQILDSGSSIEKRALNRPDFNKFIDYLVDNKIDKEFLFFKNKEQYLSFIDENFKSVGLEEKYYKHVAKQKMLQDVSKKFNGKIIMDLIPAISGKELGSLIFKFKDSFGSEDKFIDMIIFNDQNYINNKIEEFYKYTIL